MMEVTHPRRGYIMEHPVLKKDPQRSKSILFLIGAAVLWSTGGILIKLVDWNPVAISGSRSLIAGLLILAYMRKPKLKWSWPLVLGALMYASTVILFVVANKLTTAANTILLQYTAPIWVAIMAGWILKEKIRWYDWASIAVTLVGMTLFFREGISGGSFIGNIVAVFSGIGLAGVVIFLRLQKDGDPVETVLLGNFLTFFIALPFIISSGTPSTRSIIGIVLLGIFQLGCAYLLYALAIKHVTAIEGILIPVIEPILNPLWVFLFIGEKPGTWTFIGGAVVIASVTARSFIAGHYSRMSNSSMRKFQQEKSQ